MYWGARPFIDLKTITAFLYLILSIRGIHFRCFSKGAVGVLVVGVICMLNEFSLKHPCVASVPVTCLV